MQSFMLVCILRIVGQRRRRRILCLSILQRMDDDVDEVIARTAPQAHRFLRSLLQSRNRGKLSFSQHCLSLPPARTRARDGADSGFLECWPPVPLEGCLVCVLPLCLQFLPAAKDTGQDSSGSLLDMEACHGSIVLLMLLICFLKSNEL